MCVLKITKKLWISSKLVRKHWASSILIGVFLIFLISTCLDAFGAIDIPMKDYKDESFKKAQQLILGISAGAAVIIAWWQLLRLNNTSFADLLSKIELRYGSGEILEAREIIQKLYVKTSPQNDSCPNDKETSWIKHTDECQNEHIKRIQDEIKKIGKSESQSKEFVLLLNFLDFLETISYYTRVGYLDEYDVFNMFGGNLPYWAKIYAQWIKYRRWKFKKEDMYEELVKLADKMSKLYNES